MFFVTSQNIVISYCGQTTTDRHTALEHRAAERLINDVCTAINLFYIRENRTAAEDNLGKYVDHRMHHTFFHEADNILSLAGPVAGDVQIT
jgi:hypothetical protein